MSQRWTEGGWYRDYSMRGFNYVAPGFYEEGVLPAISRFLTDREAQALIPALEEHGFLKPRLDERLRVEDLKITHRLIDLLEKRP